MEIKSNMQPTAKVGFKGYQHKKSTEGLPLYNFNFLYDAKHWDCSVEFFHVKRNDYDYSYSVADKKDGQPKPYFTKQLTPNGADVDIENELKLKDSEPVAYRYKLTNKSNPSWVKYAKDDDKSVCGDNMNMISRKGTSVIVQGPMYLALPDTMRPGYVFAGFKDDNTGEIKKDPNAKDLSNFSSTFTNRAGGTMAGIVKTIPELKRRGVKRFIPTPMTGADNRGYHLYWIKKMNQPSSVIGNINNYDTMQKELFKNGMGFVSDSAYTSQGLEGVNFQYAIRWMNQADKPHEYYMFRMQGIEDAALGMGVVPKNMQNLNHKVVNAPHNYEVQSDGQIKVTKNKDYDPKQPTFIQVFDNSMVSDKQRTDKKHLIGAYDINNPIGKNKDGEDVVNQLAINTHDDTVIDNAFEIDPSEYDANIRTLNSINKNRNSSDKINLNSAQGTLLVSKFSGIEIAPKDEGGFVTWDANTDMAKLSYTESDYDTQMLESIKNPKERAIEETKLARAHAGNRDMLADSMRYWTKHVRNVQTEYTAKTLGKLGGSSEEVQDRINSLIYNRDNQQLPDDVALDDETSENIFYNDYVLRDKDVNYSKALDKAIMSVPLDSIELADDTVGALSSPYLSKRSPDLEHVGESRYDAMHDESFKVPEKYADTYNKMDKVLTNQIHEFATDVLHDVDKHSDEKIFQADGSKLTEYGQYVVPLVASDITKYAIIKSLVPSAETKVLKDGTLTYDYDRLEKEATLKNIGINGDSPEDEANQIVHKIKHGTENLNTGDVSLLSRSIRTRFKDTNALSFRYAEAMVDRSGLGLDHRIDAAKDVADMDAVRNLDDTADNQLSEVINIWAPATKAVKEENPNSLILAEFTDLYDIAKSTYGSDDALNAQNNPNSSARFKDSGNISDILIREAGMNTEANYSHFFTAGLDTFGKDFVAENGVEDGDNNNSTEERRVGLLAGALDKFADKSIDYKRNAYTFGGNHDKPRMAECYGLDMGLFHSNLDNHSTPEEINHRKTAYMLMNDMMFENDLEKPNSEYFGKTGRQIVESDENYFNNVSPMAVAKANWLRSSIGIANRIMTAERMKNAPDDNARRSIQEDSNKIYAAYSKSVKDVVNGDYYLNSNDKNDNKLLPDSYKKQLEKNGFGAKDINTTYNILTEQAKEKYDLKNTYLGDKKHKKEFDNLVEKIAIGIPAAKVRMFTQMINAIPGNPTVYAGDEFAMTGYEEKKANLYHGNRNPIDWDSVQEGNANYKEHIASHKKAMDGIVKTRANNIDAKLAPLNNGTMFKLNDVYGDSADNNRPGTGLKCPAILAQSSDGSMAVAVFNYNGISLDNPLDEGNVDINKIDEYLNPHPTDVKLDKLMLQTYKTGTNFDIPENLIFKNVDETDPSSYKSKRDDKGNCYLQRVFDDGRVEPVYISKMTAPEGVLRLYYQPDEVKESIAEKHKLEKKYTPSFHGMKKRTYFNPQYNIGVANPYSTPKNVQTGSNLSLVSSAK